MISTSTPKGQEFMPNKFVRLFETDTRRFYQKLNILLQPESYLEMKIL